MARITSKDNPYSSTSPDQTWDDIVIGSGMGGMTAAALLARAGRKVLVLEQHYVPGGFTHVFRRKGYVWDVGVHCVGEVSEKSLTGRLLADLTGGSLEWASLGQVYERFEFPDRVIEFPADREAFRATLQEHFPHESQGIDDYFQAVREVGWATRDYYLGRLVGPRAAHLVDPILGRKLRGFQQRTTAEVLDGLVKDPKLKAVLTSQWGYYGSTPANSSWAMHAMVARHFWHGGFYPVGGSERIAHCLLQTVAQHGGWTRVKASVKEVRIEGGRAQGVELEDGEFIAAKRVVCATSALSTVAHLLPDTVAQQPWSRSIARLKPSPAHLCLNLGFKGDIAKAGASPANQWFMGVWEYEGSTWDPDDLSTPPVLYTSYPSLKDPQHQPGPECRHTGEIVTFVDREFFARWGRKPWKRRGPAYEALKEELTERILAPMRQHRPELMAMLDYAELSTPLSTEHFVRSPAGAIYGIEPTPQRFATHALRPRTPIRGLFLSGSDVATVGVMGAFLGGALTALAMEPRRVGQQVFRGAKVPGGSTP